MAYGTTDPSCSNLIIDGTGDANWSCDIVVERKNKIAQIYKWLSAIQDFQSLKSGTSKSRAE